MAHLLLFAGTVIGRVALDGGEPAAGFLEPFPAYERVAPVFRRAGNALWRARFRPDFLGVVPWARADVAAAEAARAELSLATEAGAAVDVAWLDFWDSALHREPPFVLVYFGAQGAPAPARVPAPPAAGGGSRPAA